LFGLPSNPFFLHYPFRKLGAILKQFETGSCHKAHILCLFKRGIVKTKKISPQAAFYSKLFQNGTQMKIKVVKIKQEKNLQFGVKRF
jgi:hypothetical protein